MKRCWKWMENPEHRIRNKTYTTFIGIKNIYRILLLTACSNARIAHIRIRMCSHWYRFNVLWEFDFRWNWKCNVHCGEKLHSHRLYSAYVCRHVHSKQEFNIQFTQWKNFVTRQKKTEEKIRMNRVNTIHSVPSITISSDRIGNRWKTHYLCKSFWLLRPVL